MGKREGNNHLNDLELDRRTNENGSEKQHGMT